MHIRFEMFFAKQPVNINNNKACKSLKLAINVMLPFKSNATSSFQNDQEHYILLITLNLLLHTQILKHFPFSEDHKIVIQPQDKNQKNHRSEPKHNVGYDGGNDGQQQIQSWRSKEKIQR